ncbi:MAG TPA: hypothetical protein VLV89_07910 [Candidatus Acidoferrum sp.]|nr:hypothetical protein [Candidatus Acidoferrum sp.]
MILPKSSNPKPIARPRFKDLDWEEFKDFFFSPNINPILYLPWAFIGLLILGSLKIFEWLGGRK